MKIFLKILLFFFLVTQICFAQWVQVGLNGKSIDEIAVKDQIIFATTDEYSGDPLFNLVGKLYRSLDNGINWTMIADSCLDVEISPTGKVFMIKDSSWFTFWRVWDSLYTSTDYGESWLLSDAVVQLADSFGYYCGTECIWPKNITVSPEGNIILTILYGAGGFGTVRTGFAISNDDGLTWPTPGPSINGGHKFDFKNQQVITHGWMSGSTTGAGYMYLSSDYGITWDFLGDLPIPVYAIGLFTNNNIIIETDEWGNFSQGIHISEDFCNTWTQIANINGKTGLTLPSGSEEGYLVGTEDLGVFLFSDEGDSLGSRNEGLTNLNIHTLSLDNIGYVYAGTESGVWRRPLSEIVTSIENEITQPTEFILSQNYPNPFNPSTKIKYSIPQTSNVVIKIYDVLGSEVATLVNEEKSVGTYELNWNAANLSSGVYVYRLQAGSFVQTRKMILLK